VEDRPRRGVQVMSAMDARPRLALLLSSVATMDALSFALRAVSRITTRRVAVAPKPLKASVVVWKLAHELHERILRVRRLVILRVFAVSRCHTCIVLQCSYTVKG
jgi:hypothetical protein